MNQTVGIHEGKSTAATRKRFPQHTLAREFINPQQSALPFDASRRFGNVCTGPNSEGVCVWVSFKPKPVDVASGSWSAPLRATAEWFRNNPNNVLIIHHEPEDDYSGRTFRDMFNRCADTLRAGYPEIRLCYAANTYQWLPDKASTARPQDWQGINANIYAADVYSGGTSFPPTATLAEHVGFQRWLEYIAPSGPYALAERGWGAHVKRVETIARESVWLETHPDGQRVTDYIVWNTGDDKGVWPLDGQAETAVGALFAKAVAAPPPPDEEAFLLFDEQTPTRPAMLLHKATGIVVADTFQARFLEFYGKAIGS